VPKAIETDAIEVQYVETVVIDTLALEAGLTFYYAHEAEFRRREVPLEKQVALAYEAGLQAGRHEIKEKVVRVFRPDRGCIWA
jgi:hypothetical protein